MGEKMSGLTHIDSDGNAVMVDVSEKADTERKAVACGKIFVNAEVFEAITTGTVKKGDVLTTAKIAGIMAAKNTSSLIPMCHPLLLTHISVDFALNKEELCVECTATVRLCGKTGVEMEALTAVNVALLTVYDMCKALDKRMRITDVMLLEKEGGKSGKFVRDGWQKMEEK